MRKMKYFIPNETYDNAIKNEEKGVLRALLIGIIGSDPTFATTKYDEATDYVKDKSKEMNGRVLDLVEAYRKQEAEYTKPQESWDEEYYQMLLVWYRDNYAVERLPNIKKVGKEVYKDKPTWGKSRVPDPPGNVSPPDDDPPLSMWQGMMEWFIEKWKWVVLLAGFVAVIATIIRLLSNK